MPTARKPRTTPETRTGATRAPGSYARLGPIAPRAGAQKKSHSFYVDPLLLEEARDAAVALYGNPDAPRNLSQLVEEGLRRELLRLQDEFNASEPFPLRRVELQRGGNTRDF